MQPSLYFQGFQSKNLTNFVTFMSYLTWESLKVHVAQQESALLIALLLMVILKGFVHRLI